MSGLSFVGKERVMFVNTEKWSCDDRIPSREGLSDLYLQPNTSPAAEIASLAAHSSFLNRGVAPVHLAKAMDRVERRYLRAQWNANLDWDADDVIELTLGRLNPRSTPGEQLNVSFSTIGDWLKHHEIVDGDGIITHPAIVARVRQRIKEIALPDYKSRVRTFIKQELHKKKKIDQNLHRLISGFDAVDQIVDHLVFWNSLASEKANHEDIPTKVGMSFSGGGWHANLGLFGNERVIDVDKSHWDWSVAAWELNADRDIRRRLCKNWEKTCSEYKLIYERRYEHLLLTHFVTSSGAIYKQDFPAGMKSGHLLTISANSRMQVLLRELYEARVEAQEKREYVNFKIVAMGDDTIETAPVDPESYTRFLKEMGHEPKRFTQGVLGDGRVSFCSQSTKIVNGKFVPVPDNFEKHYMVLRLKPKAKYLWLEQTLQQLLVLYAFSDMYTVFKDLADRNHFKYVSREYAQSFLSGTESICSLGDKSALRSTCQVGKLSEHSVRFVFDSAILRILGFVD